MNSKGTNLKVELLFVTPNSEEKIESAGRTSYLSFNRQKEGSEKKFIRMLIKRGDFSVLEHAYATFRISGVSRAFTHQLVRHRLCSFTQQSQRNINESDFKYVEPNSILRNEKAHEIYVKYLSEVRNVYKELLSVGIKYEDARYVLPNSIESQIVVTANFREWRHIMELRGSPEAQWEIRKVSVEILKILKQHAPTVFEDFIIDSEKKFIKRNQ
jgi:thymidylate synthase (FAD)